MKDRRLNKAVLTDAGFWIAVAEGDEKAVAVAENLKRFHVFVPWPVVYESTRTKMVRKVRDSLRLERALADLAVEHACDSSYRGQALKDTFRSAEKGRPLSLVDVVIRALLNDPTRHFYSLVTNNPNDFRDVCASRGVDLVDIRD